MQSRRTLFLGICKFIVNLRPIRHIFLDNSVLKIIIVNGLIINLLTIFVEVINVSEIPAEKLKETVALFMRTDRMRRSVFERQASDRFGIHQKQHITLMHLSRNEDISQKQLAEHFKVSPAAVAVSLKKLESKGLISRQCSSDDSRRNALKITEKGRAMVNETHKIFADDSIGVSPTTVRVPVQGGHSESINLEFEKEFTLEDVRKMMEETPGVTLQDDPTNCVYPMPLYACGKNDVFVGRFRKDPSVKSGLNFWCVADNLRKGAATNAVQIAEKLIEKGFLPKE